MVALNSESKVQLIHAVKSCVSKTRKYKEADIAERINIITVEAIAIMHNMNFTSAIGATIERDYSNKETFKDIYVNMKNKYIINEIQQQLKCYLEDKVISARIRVAITEIRDLIMKMNDTEGFLNSAIKPRRNTLTMQVLKDKAYDMVTKELKMKSPGRSKATFLTDPAKFVSEVTSMNGSKVNQGNTVILKLSLIKAIIGAAFIPKSKLDLYVSYVNAFAGKGGKIDDERYKEYVLNNCKIIPHMVFKLRMSEMNAVLVDHVFSEKGFNELVENVYESCIKAKELGLNSYLQVTNLIINNIIVEVLNNPILNKDLFKTMSIKYVGNTKNMYFDVLLGAVAAYVSHNYKNKYNRVCAYTVESAIQKSISAVNTFAEDAFSEPDESTEHVMKTSVKSILERKDA